VSQDEQRRMARPTGCDRVHGVVTRRVIGLVAKVVSVHLLFLREIKRSTAV
jgi:hypothetical protein